MDWINLTDDIQLGEIAEQSKRHAVLIFKYSSRCGISDVARHRLERETPPETVKFYFLDIIRHRSLSNLTAEKFQVHHESPQVLLIKNGECIYDESHNGINMADIAEQATGNNAQ